MANGPEWFAPKRYGYGAGLPISWQGWALTLGFFAATLGLAIFLQRHPLELIAALVPLTTALLVICSRTTRGGWRWRWGKED
jgi:hypothetical protein